MFKMQKKFKQKNFEEIFLLFILISLGIYKTSHSLRFYAEDLMSMEFTEQ